MRYFAAINPANNEIEGIRSSKSREYKAAVAIQWPGEEIGVGSFHSDEALAHKASQQYVNRGAYVEIWEVREISKAEHAEARERFKAIIEGREAPEAPEAEASEAVEAEAEAVDQVELRKSLVKEYRLSWPMQRDLAASYQTALGSKDEISEGQQVLIRCHDGMTSKGLRARGLMGEGGRNGWATDEGLQVAQVMYNTSHLV